MVKLIHRGDVYPCTTIDYAVKQFCFLRDESGEGVSTWQDGIIVDDSSRRTYRVSYNGRIWEETKGTIRK